MIHLWNEDDLESQRRHIRMCKFLSKFIHDCLTEDDGQSYCLAKVTAILAVISFWAFAGYGVSISHSVDLDKFSTGLMEVLGGAGALIAGKQATQKKDI